MLIAYEIKNLTQSHYFLMKVVCILTMVSFLRPFEANRVIQIWINFLLCWLSHKSRALHSCHLNDHYKPRDFWESSSRTPYFFLRTLIYPLWFRTSFMDVPFFQLATLFNRVRIYIKNTFRVHTTWLALSSIKKSRSF